MATAVPQRNWAAVVISELATPGGSPNRDGVAKSWVVQVVRHPPPLLPELSCPAL